MARITEEQKIQINELYCQLGVKAQVARELGVSASTVSKYIIPNYIPLSERKEVVFNKKPQIIDSKFFENKTKIDVVRALMMLSDEEKSELKLLQKGVY